MGDCPGLEPDGVERVSVATAYVDVVPRLAPRSDGELDLLGEIRLIVREELQAALQPEQRGAVTERPVQRGSDSSR